MRSTVSLPLACLLAGLSFATVHAQTEPVTLKVDATDAPRQILHARLRIPAQPGELTLVYPKWLPGEHGPEGPITDLTGLKFSANFKPLVWRRDADDMFAFHVTVPDGAEAVDVTLDFLLPSGNGNSGGEVSATAKLLVLNWNEVVLYPKGSSPHDLQFAASLKLPEGWKFGTALPVVGESGAQIEFSPVSLETLVDSPVISGSYFRTIDLSPGKEPRHFLHIAADSAAALEIKPEDIGHFEHLVAEENALFGAHHYRSYHFLLTLSDHVSHFGLEHHESSDNRRVEDYLTDANARQLGGSLLPHEMVHSWNGKYRRPAGLATPDYQQPMEGELLWVYEGLTTYLGDVLATRSGLWTNETYREELAGDAAALDNEPGRTWRPLSDTTVAAQLLYRARGEGSAWRRRVDFYPEGELIWLEADTIIRRQSHGQHSLDDFCKEFYGAPSGPPKVVPYTFEDIVNALNKILPYDWRGFFEKRVYSIEPRAPLGGIENAGWRLAYTNDVPAALKMWEGARKLTDVRYSLGLTVQNGESTVDVIPESPADQAGVGPGMKLVAVNGRRWTPEILRTAIKQALTNSAPIELLVENDDYFKTCRVDYHGGEKYPCLERDSASPDLLSEILKPLTPAPAVPETKK